jgi:hypothetical protein
MVIVELGLRMRCGVCSYPVGWVGLGLFSSFSALLILQ